MTETDRDEFLMLMDGLASAFGIEPTTALKLGYWMGLKDLELASVNNAIGRAICECKHMPRPVEIRGLAGEMTNDGRAVLAWDALKRAIAQHGAYRSVDFDDPVINATVRNLGGWQKLCAIGNEEFDKWTRRDFERVYCSLLQTGTSHESCNHLVGKHELENGAAGFPIDPPSRFATGLPPHRDGRLARLSVRTLPAHDGRQDFSATIRHISEAKSVS